MKRGPFHVAGFPDPGILRPAPTAARPPGHFPGAPVIDQASLTATRQATGPRRLSRVPRTTIRTFNAQYAGGFLSARSWTEKAFHGLRRGLTGSAPSLPTRRRVRLTTLAQASLALQTIRSIPPASHPASRPRTEAHYQGPTHLPGPDSHRQAIPNLTLLRHVVLLYLSAPEQSRRTRRKRETRQPAFGDLRDQARAPTLISFGTATGCSPTPTRSSRGSCKPR